MQCYGEEVYIAKTLSSWVDRRSITSCGRNIIVCDGYAYCIHNLIIIFYSVCMTYTEYILCLQISYTRGESDVLD